jgi:tripartite-type tricarboxylate transporter receptor subunit TctC
MLVSRAARIVFATLLALAAAPPGPARAADDYPTRAVTFVVPFPPAGGTDILARLLAQELTEKLKQPFVIENKPGAGTLVGAQYVAASKPDGYTLLLAPVTTLAINPHVYKTLGFDPIKDFAPIGLVGQSEFCLIVNNDLGVKTLPDLIALIKSKPGQMAYGSSGSGTPHHLFMEMFSKMAGLEMVHVPYRGSVAAMTDVMTGQIPLMIVDLAPAMSLIQDHKITPIAVTAPTRAKAMPDIPTMAEAGLPGYAGIGWFSVVAKGGTPSAIVHKIDDVLMKFIQRPEIQDRLNGVAIRPVSSTPEELEKYITTEIVKWGKIVKDAGITPQ